MRPERPPYHTDSTRFMRYHCQVHMPEVVQEAALEFLPPAGTELKLSRHYRQLIEAGRRDLPTRVLMPEKFTVVEATVTRDTGVIFRVLIRFIWNERSDLALVLEGDWEIVTAFWKAATDWHSTLDKVNYEQGEEEARKQSRPDDVT